jgi:DNA-binding transcriptional LysR family regulator
MFIYRLKVFLAVAKERNMTKVAENMNISLSALSMHIKNLEDELGLKLFKRHARGVELSENAKSLLGYARTAVETAEDVRRKAQELKGELKGSITVGLNTDPEFLRLNRINQSIAETMPDVTVRFSITETVKSVGIIHEKIIDVGFTYGELEDSKITSIPLTTVRVYVVAPTDIYRKLKSDEWGDLQAYPWIISNECPFIKPMQNVDATFQVPQKMIFAEDEVVMAELVKSGSGIAMIREDKAFELRDKGFIEIFEKRAVDIPLCINFLTSRKDEDILKKAVDGIRDIF